MSSSSESNSALPFDETAACDDCGCFGAYRVATEKLCGECYTLRGACCAGTADRELGLECSLVNASPERRPSTPPSKS